MIHIACESKLRPAVRSHIHPCPGNWVAMGHSVAYCSQAARAFSAGIKCQHCRHSGRIARRWFSLNNGENAITSDAFTNPPMW